MKSMTPLTKTVSAALGIVFLAQCTNIQDDQTRTRTEGALAGSALGAAAGAIIGNQSHRAWEGAFIGGAVGGAAGLAYGDHVARQKAKYKSQEQWLDACISHAQQVNDAAIAYNDKLSQRIAHLEARLRKAKAAGDRQQMQQIKQSVLSLQKQTKQQINAVDVEIHEQNSVIQQTSIPALRSKVGDLSSTRSQLSDDQKRLADLGNQIDV